MLAVSFLTPYWTLFALAAAVPLAALAATERRATRIRQLFAVAGPGRRALVPVVVALVLLPVLVGIAAAQPVVVRQKLLSERADAEAFFVFDTSLSMTARSAADTPTRLARAKRLALRLRDRLADVPIGIATMTDRTLPELMPTTDSTLFTRTLAASVGIDRPPPSQPYRGRATTFGALVPILQSHFFATSMPHRLIVVFTDGEASRIPSSVKYLVHPGGGLTVLFVHVWQPGERIFEAGGRPDRGYVSDPTSGDALATFARLMNGTSFPETQLGAVAAAAQAGIGHSGTERRVESYARMSLAPWVLLAGVLPLGFLLWRRNL
ncbi:MAG TPA: VWA domain-containing protein [Gaiellaceae bacterium]|nr:VWA domain-containing protein [Gaiellaceae bacterium]